jgi:DNA invertase Pin-like site-specific DNA recombinase
VGRRDHGRGGRSRAGGCQSFRPSATTPSNSSLDRPGLSRWLQVVASGLVSDVVVWRLDRLGRTAKGLTALFDDLIQRKVNLRVP